MKHSDNINANNIDYRVQELQQQLSERDEYIKELEGGIEFYGEDARWVPMYSSDDSSPAMHRCCNDDFKYFDMHFKKGGKRARAIMKNKNWGKWSE